MSTTLHNQLQAAGYRPHKPMSLESAVGRIFQQVTRPLRVQVTRAGAYYKARWEGQRSFCFGDSITNAIERLRSDRLGSMKSGKPLMRGPRDGVQTTHHTGTR